MKNAIPTDGVLVIDRSRWRRGGSKFDGQFGRTHLLNNKGMMCCLGFDALACGVLKKDIFEVANPVDVGGEKVPDAYINTRGWKRGSVEEYAVQNAISANDDQYLSEPEREIKIRGYLMKLGWKDVVFVDGKEGQ